VGSESALVRWKREKSLVLGIELTAQPLYPAEKAPLTHWIGGCVGPRAGLDTV
jgi:hypothetical protein